MQMGQEANVESKLFETVDVAEANSTSSGGEWEKECLKAEHSN